MIRGRNPSEMMWRDMGDMRAELENRVQAVSPGRLLPAGGMGDRMLPVIRGEFRVDVWEHGDDVIVVADLPGVEKEPVTCSSSTRGSWRSPVHASGIPG